MGRRWMGILAGLGLLLFSAAGAWALPNWLNDSYAIGNEEINHFMAPATGLTQTNWWQVPTVENTVGRWGEDGEAISLWGDWTSIVNRLVTDWAPRLLPDVDMEGFRPRVIENYGNGSVPTPVPEPATLLLLGIGLIGTATFYRKGVKR